MKKTIRNILILCFAYCGLAYLYRSWHRKKGPLVRVLCFHDVRDRQWFEDLIAEIVEKYHILSVEDFETKTFDEKRINILLTFDDGYKSWVDVVLPVLERYKMQGIFFVNSGLLDVAGTDQEQEFVQNNLLLTTERRFLSWEDLTKLHKSGQVIGGHTVSHQRLTALTSKEVEKEVGEDKQRLESHLLTKLHHFAYPFGTKTDISKSISLQIKQSGYEYVCGAVSGWYNSTSLNQSISRLLIEDNVTPKHVRNWIEGSYDLFHFLRQLRQ